MCGDAIVDQNTVKLSAPGEDRTHDLQMALSFVIMRLTRYLLRYRGTKRHVTCGKSKNVFIWDIFPSFRAICDWLKGKLIW